MAASSVAVNHPLEKVGKTVKKYLMEEFDIISKEGGKGGYGQAIPAKIKATGQEVILKKYHADIMDLNTLISHYHYFIENNQKNKTYELRKNGNTVYVHNNLENICHEAINRITATLNNYYLTLKGLDNNV